MITQILSYEDSLDLSKFVKVPTLLMYISKNKLTSSKHALVFPYKKLVPAYDTEDIIGCFPNLIKVKTILFKKVVSKKRTDIVYKSSDDDTYILSSADPNSIIKNDVTRLYLTLKNFFFYKKECL